MTSKKSVFRMLLFATLVLALILLTFWRSSARGAAANAAYPAQGRLIDVDGTPVHVLIAGSGPDLVLLHGANGNLRDWTFDFVDRVSDRYRVIMFDRPGLGQSGRLPGKSGPWNSHFESPKEQAILLQKAAAIVGIDTPVVVGHSFGGAVALAWALEQPEDTAALVMLGGVSNPWPGDLGKLYQINSSPWGGALAVPLLSAFVPAPYIDDSIESVFAPHPTPDGYATHAGVSLALRRETMRANAQQVNGLRPHIVRMSKHYSSLSLPIEIIHGDQDTIVPLAIHSVPLSNQATNAQLTVLKGTGHMPHHTDPQAVVDAIDRAAQRAGLR
ncbi:MAG: alpha/beta hydrolase [Sulfitobacter sp.]